MKHVLFITLLLALLGIWNLQTLHAGHSLDQVEQLYQSGETAQSLQAVHAYLRDWPNEPRGMFLRGLILERLGEDDEAMAAYRELIRIHPEFPEPYNNLARLLAAQGRYEEAKKTLHQALQTHPSYAAAHQNLSKIYSAMASQAYRRVLGSEDDAVQVSLAPLEELTTPAEASLLAESSAPDSGPVASPNPQIVAQVPAIPVVEALPERKPDPKPEQEQELKPAAGQDQVQEPQSTEAVQPQQTPREQAMEPQPTPQPILPRPVDLLQEMQAVLQAWAKAWADQDVQAYLGFYSDSFVPGGGQTHDAWREQRRLRVSAPPFINITLSDVAVERTEQDAVQVRFSQHYRSNVINDQVRKELLFRKENGQWRIIRERLLPR